MTSNSLHATTMNNTEQEEVWIAAWNDLADLIDENPGAYILLPECMEASKDEAQGWIQDAAYESNRVKLKVAYFKGKKSIYINKTPH